ncbi:MAG: hypothetical protein ACJAVK_002302, partial [Akkermansiaceae bacterium]
VQLLHEGWHRLRRKELSPVAQEILKTKLEKL